jgi:SDR family mycofactocin-dependent oxidoreductase
MDERLAREGELVGSLEGKVALVTGAARGQGRSHAVRLAQEGASIIAVDICDQIEAVTYPLSTPEDLKETARLVEMLDKRIVTYQADVRDFAQLSSATDHGIGELGPLDIVVANAGIWAVSVDQPQDRARRERVWQDTIDVNLTGVWHTLEATIPAMVARGAGGSVTLISSTAGLKGSTANDLSLTAYTAAKHALVGLMRGYAKDLAPYSIRVNTVHPTGVTTPMNMNDVVSTYLEKNPSLAEVMANALPVPSVEPVDISNAIVYLASDSGRYVTGVTLSVDAGFNIR